MSLSCTSDKLKKQQEMMLLQFLVTLALLQLVQLQGITPVNASTITGNGSGQCVSRAEFEITRAETITLRDELDSWQNTTISILKTYLIDQGVGQCACTTDIKQLWEKMDRVQDSVTANNASSQEYFPSISSLGMQTESVTLQQQLLQYIQEQNKTLQEMASCRSQNTIQHFPNGTFQNPASSCKDIEQGSPSGYYWVRRSAGGYASQVYCNMTRRCCGSTGGWMRVADLDMTNPNHHCPQGFRTITSPKRTCRRPNGGPGCVSTTFPVHGIRYQKVCGRAIGYQLYATDGFAPYHFNRHITIDGAYIDGISLTHGHNPRKHVWSFAATLDETRSNYDVCPCTKTDAVYTGVIPPFVGQDYFCDTGSRYHFQNRIYIHDPLWDGHGCGPRSTCCSFNSPPWFCKQLPQPTTDDIELRLCSDEATHEDALIELVELYVQ